MSTETVPPIPDRSEVIKKALIRYLYIVLDLDDDTLYYTILHYTILYTEEPREGLPGRWPWA
jgi:hypothetical protein